MSRFWQGNFATGVRDDCSVEGVAQGDDFAWRHPGDHCIARDVGIASSDLRDNRTDISVCDTNEAVAWKQIGQGGRKRSKRQKCAIDMIRIDTIFNLIGILAENQKPGHFKLSCELLEIGGKRAIITVIENEYYPMRLDILGTANF